MMYVKDLVSSLISAEEGWAVRDQFEITFEEQEEFEQQNSNALVRVLKICKNLHKSRLLCEDAQDELHAYIEKLEEYLQQA